MKEYFFTIEVTLSSTTLIKYTKRLNKKGVFFCHRSNHAELHDTFEGGMMGFEPTTYGSNN